MATQVFPRHLVLGEEAYEDDGELSMDGDVAEMRQHLRSIDHQITEAKDRIEELQGYRAVLTRLLDPGDAEPLRANEVVLLLTEGEVATIEALMRLLVLEGHAIPFVTDGEGA